MNSSSLHKRDQSGRFSPEASALEVRSPQPSSINQCGSMQSLETLPHVLKTMFKNAAERERERERVSVDFSLDFPSSRTLGNMKPTTARTMPDPARTFIP